MPFRVDSRRDQRSNRHILTNPIPLELIEMVDPHEQFASDNVPIGRNGVQSFNSAS
jgi:hypothetical protein